MRRPGICFGCRAWSVKGNACAILRDEGVRAYDIADNCPFADLQSDEPAIPYKEPGARHGSNKSRPIMAISDDAGRMFASVKEAADEMHLPATSVRKAAITRKEYAGYVWKFV